MQEIYSELDGIDAATIAKVLLPPSMGGDLEIMGELLFQPVCKKKIILKKCMP